MKFAKIPKLFHQAFDRFDDLFSPSDREMVLRELSSPSRFYHGIGHHGCMLTEIMRRQLPDEFILAAIFHDYVYDPKSATNEEDSALLVKKFLTERSQPEALIHNVSDLILCTKDHLPRDEAQRIFSEIDCLILATSSKSTYRWYANGIRLEYSMVENSRYRTGRAAVLDHLSNNMHGFFSEAQISAARANFAWEKHAISLGSFDIEGEKR